MELILVSKMAPRTAWGGSDGGTFETINLLYADDVVIFAESPELLQMEIDV